jgi:hypothetical protein
MGQVLDDLIPGDSTEIDEATLGMLFPPGEAGVIDERTRSAATRFARDHGCRFLFDGHSSRSTFLKLPGRWHALIDNLCTDLGREMPGTEDPVAYFAFLRRNVISAASKGSGCSRCGAEQSTSTHFHAESTSTQPWAGASKQSQLPRRVNFQVELADVIILRNVAPSHPGRSRTKPR